MKLTKKTIGWTCLTIALLTAFGAYWHYLSYFPSTDDAYVNANIININANISGQVDKLYVSDNQEVKKGQLLYTIDQKPYEIALLNAQAIVDSTLEQINANKAAVNITKQKIKLAESRYKLDKKNSRRILTLVKAGKASIAEGDRITTQLQVSESNLAAAQNAFQQALATLGKPGKDNATYRKALANLKDAKLKLRYTHVYAPKTGKITKLSLRAGDFIVQGQTNFALIESNPYWIDANFKETQLENIRPGQSVKISIDMYPSKKIQGRVESISGGTGNRFSLLPQENATGNWVKVTQRLPVRIAILNVKEPLAIGTSANVTVDTRQ